MKFNPDCVRDILLTAEDVITDTQTMDYSPDCTYERLESYPFPEVAYHIAQCQESGLIRYKKDILGHYHISAILPSGNELIAKIRNESAWKSMLAKGIHSIPTMISIANGVFGLIKNIKLC